MAEDDTSSEETALSLEKRMSILGSENTAEVSPVSEHGTSVEDKSRSHDTDVSGATAFTEKVRSFKSDDDAPENSKESTSRTKVAPQEEKVKKEEEELPADLGGGFGIGFGAAMAAIGSDAAGLTRSDSIDSSMTDGSVASLPAHGNRKPAKSRETRQSRRESMRRDSLRLSGEGARRVSISLKKRIQAAMGVPTASVTADSAEEDKDGGNIHSSDSKNSTIENTSIVEYARQAAEATENGGDNDSSSEPSTSAYQSRRSSHTDMAMVGDLGSGKTEGDDKRSHLDDKGSVQSVDEADQYNEAYSSRKQTLVKKRESHSPSMFDQAAGKVYENLDELKERLEYRQNCIMPDSTFLLYWRKLVMCALIYCTIVVPYQVVFETYSELGLNYVTIGDVLVCTMLSADIVLNFFTAYETKDNVVVCKRQHIALNYANSWLLLDLCTTLPLDIIFSSSASSNKGVARYLRLITLLRIARLTKMLHKNMKGKQITSIRRLINVLFMTLSLCHYNACFFYFISTAEGSRAYTWKLKYDPDGSILKTSTDKYIRSMYWSIVTLTTTGYGDIVPVTNWEAVWSVTMMLVGITVFSYLTGVIASAVSNSDSRQRYIHEQMASLQSMLDYRKIPSELREHVESYYARHLQHEALADEERVLSKLPLSLRKDILMVIHGDTVLKAEIFKVPEISGQPAVVERIVATLSTLVYPPNLIVMNMNDLADAIYFLDKGFMEEFVKIDELLQIKAKKKKHQGKELHQTTRLLGPGKVYGEVGVTLHVVELLYLRSLTFCDVARLGRDDLLAIFDDFPPVADALRDQAQKIRSRQELLVETLKSFARGEDREKWNRYKLARKRFQALTNTVQKALDSRLYSENEIMQFLTYSTLRQRLPSKPTTHSSGSERTQHSESMKAQQKRAQSGFGVSLFSKPKVKDNS